MTGARSRFVRAAVVAAALALSLVPSPARASNPRPNVLIVLSDDQSWSTFSRALMPQTFSNLVDQGTLYRRAYVNTPLCCPSRAQLLTGLQSHHNGVIYNSSQLRRPTIVPALHDAGYRTMLAGKYLNSWPCDPRPEFDRWVCAASGQSTYSLIDPTLNVDGTWATFDGYQPDVLALLTAQFIASTPADQPFFALYTPTTPHLPADDPRYSSLPVAPYRPPSYGVSEPGKPAYMQRGPFTTNQQLGIDGRYARMSRAVRSLDDSVGLLLSSLGSRASNTLVVYLSDNGYLFGEHARWDKLVPYEESVRVPMVVRYPPAGTGPRVSDALVSNVDIAPTIAKLAGVPWTTDGSSLLPTLDGVGSTRRYLLIESCFGSITWCPGTGTFESQRNVPGYYGIVAPRFVFIRYGTGERELYDLGQDPYERNNLAGLSEWSEAQHNLALKLISLVSAPPHDA